MLDFQQGQVAEARAGYQEALRLAQELGDTSAIQAETHGLAVLDWQQGRMAEARAGYEEALRLAHELGDRDAEQLELRSLAETIRYLGLEERAQARALLREALAISKQLGSPYNVGVNYEFLGRLEEQERHRQAAIAAYGEALQRFERLESPRADAVREALRSLEEDVRQDE